MCIDKDDLIKAFEIMGLDPSKIAAARFFPSEIEVDEYVLDEDGHKVVTEDGAVKVTKFYPVV